MLAAFSVTNYRSFVDFTRVELRPLTLLFGYNNAGKSALLRVLPLIADSLLEPGRSPLNLGAASRGGSFEDLVSRLRPSGGGLGLELAWAESSSFEVEIRHLHDLYREVVTEMRLVRGDQRVDAQWIPESGPGGRLGNRYELSEEGGDGARQIRLDFEGLMPKIIESEEAAGVNEMITLHRKDLQLIASGVQWISSLRATPQRSFKPSSAPPLRLGPDGGGFEDALFFDKVDRRGLLGEISSWFERHFAQVLDLLRRGDHAFISLSPVDAAELQVPLADTGEGMAQVLPVLVALALARRAAEETPQILVLEQPELHLHPAAELALAQRFAETVSASSPPTLVVETHSENLMLSVQLQIAKGHLSPDAVLAYWVERLEDGRSLVRRVEFDDLGQTAGWPPGIFSEDMDLARQLFLLRREKKK